MDVTKRRYGLSKRFQDGLLVSYQEDLFVHDLLSQLPSFFPNSIYLKQKKVADDQRLFCSRSTKTYLSPYGRIPFPIFLVGERSFQTPLVSPITHVPLC